MPRSKWKGLFCDVAVTKHVQKVLDAGGPKTQSLPIRVWSRRSAILPEFVGYRFEVHNGKVFVPLEVRDGMVGHKFGEFSFTRRFPTFPEKVLDFSAKKKKQASH